jgi:hypothetical protein
MANKSEIGKLVTSCVLAVASIAGGVYLLVYGSGSTEAVAAGIMLCAAGAGVAGLPSLPLFGSKAK